MDPPGITRHRRPFLAPVWLTLVAALVIGGVAVAFYRSATTTVVLLVPPVEKEPGTIDDRSEEHTSELQSRGHLVCRRLLEKKRSMLDLCRAFGGVLEIVVLCAAVLV